MRTYFKEELKERNIILARSGDAPEKIEIYQDEIKVYAKDEVYHIPVESLRGKAIMDRLNYKGELTQEIYI